MSQQDVLDCLRQQLQAEGLLTAEQREALQHLIELAEDGKYPAWHGGKLVQSTKIVRDLLTGSEPAWEATEERRAALDAFSTILTVIGCVPCHSYICTHFIKHIKVLRAMLEEVGQK